MQNNSIKYAHLNQSILQEINGPDEFNIDIRIDTQKHCYLYDHCFGGKALVPATMIIELFCETALYFIEQHPNYKKDNLVVQAIQDYLIERAIAIDLGNSIDITFILHQIEKKGHNYHLQIEIASKRINTQGKVLGNRTNARAEVILGQETATNQLLDLPLYTDYHYYNFNIQDYYGYYYPSHGPLFQSLTGKFVVDKNLKYLLGEYNCADKETDFIKGQKSDFVISPLGYDSTLQYAVFLARIQTLRGRLPVGAKKITIHKKHPVKGKCYALIDCLSIDEDIMISNIFCFDHNKVLIMQAEKFKVQKAFYHQYARDEFDNRMQANKIQQMEWALSK